MFKTKFINPNRRDILKQLTAAGAVIATGTFMPAYAQTDSTLGSNISAVRRGDDSYEALRSRSLWRGNLPDRYPDIIVEAVSVDDLRDALAFARGNDLQVVCRASGHSTSGAPLRNGGMMIHVNRMNSVSINVNAQTAIVEPGVTMAGLFGMAAQSGLDFPTADCSNVAIAGFILGGGFGRNCMHLVGGPVCNALLSADVMLENGEVITVNEDNHGDLFWAMRGCGPAFFGIVTSMTLQLFDPPGASFASTYRYSFDALPSLVEFFDRHAQRHDPRVSNHISIQPNPNNPTDSIAQVRIAAYADIGPDAESEARDLLAYYADAGLGEKAFEKNELEEQQLSTYMYTTDPTAGTHSDNIFTDDSSALLAVSSLMQSRPEGFGILLDMSYNTQFYPSTGDKVAFSAAGKHFLSAYVNWKNPTPERNAIAYEWADKFAKVVAQYGQGNYLNQVDSGMYPEKVRQSLSADSWERLALVRQQYDPGNRFFSYVGIADSI